MDYSFPRVEFPLYASAEQASGQSRQYLEPRINATAAGSFSAAAMGANGALMFRRQAKGRYVNYHTPCLPLAPPNIRTPYDPVSEGKGPSVTSQVTYLQWNYKDVYVPPQLLYELLTDATAVEQQNAEYDPLLGSAVACLSFHDCSFTSVFFASGPLLHTLTCGVLYHPRSGSHHLAVRECEAYQMPGRILEIQATRSQGKEFVCVRTSYHAAFLQGPSEEAISSVLEDVSAAGGSKVTHRLLTILATFRTDHCIASVTVSPYIAGEGLVVTETGGIYFWCQGQPLQVLQQPLATPSPSCASHFWRCCYGSHPRNIVLAEHSGVSLGDFRSSCLLFSPLLTSPSEWLPTNTLISSLSPTSHPHQFHIGTSHSLLSLDSRQPHWPLLQESHDLSHAPQIMSTTTTQDNHWLVMLCDCVGRENVVFTYSRGGAAAEPIHSTCAAHVAACYGDLEDQWQGKTALPLLGNRLKLPVSGASLFSLRRGNNSTEMKGDREEGGEGEREGEREREREGEREGASMETFAAISMSALGDLFYQLWSYGETPPTDTPNSHNDSWLQEAWLQEQELQVTREEWHAATPPVNFNPLLEYLESSSSAEQCPACLATQSTHFPSSPPHTSSPSQNSPPSHHTPTAPQTLWRRCGYCGGRMAPLRSRKLEQKLVAEGLMEGVATNTASVMQSHTVAMAAEAITMATVKGLERLRACCDVRDPGVDGNHDDRVFWEGWKEGGGVEEVEGLDTTPTARSHTSVQEKPCTPSSQPRNRGKRMGF